MRIFFGFRRSVLLEPCLGHHLSEQVVERFWWEGHVNREVLLHLGEGDDIRFTGEDGAEGELRNVALPWRLNVQAPVDVDRVYSLSSQVTVGGDVTGMIATITVGDQPVSQGVVPGDPGGFNQTRTARAVWRYQP